MHTCNHDAPAFVSAGDIVDGRYEIECAVGAGASATVFAAHDLRCNRRVAIKFLTAAGYEENAAQRFENEMATMGSLQHPNIVPLFDRGELDGTPFYVMPFVSGETLRQRIDRTGPLPLEEAIRLAMTMARALEFAHRQGVVHRDIKPENILLSDGEAMIADFGIAFSSRRSAPRLTGTGASIGTPLYMSPEQISGDEVDARSDIYSLAALVYEMLCGTPPHAGENTRVLMTRILAVKPRRVSAMRSNVPSQLDAALAKALEKAPADRFDSACEFSHAISRVRVRV